MSLSSSGLGRSRYNRSPIVTSETLVQIQPGTPYIGACLPHTSTGIAMQQIANRDHCRLNFTRLLTELELIEKDYLSLVSPELQKQYTELLQTQKMLKNDPVFNASARLVRFLHTRYLKFLEDLEVGKQNNRLSIDLQVDKIFAHSPIIIASKVPGKVYVFPNLILDTLNLSDLRNICWIICFNGLKTFNKTRCDRPNSWKPFSRAWRKIKRYEEISITRALTRYTNIKRYLRDDQINALADSYIELTRPLKLIYAEKPKDYVTMFSGNGVNTCMTLTPCKSKEWYEILKHGHHPMSLFAYHPDIKGVYCIKNKQVVARTCIYQTHPGAWQYGRLFTINSFYNSKFVNMLTSVGYTQLDNRFSKNIKIKIPGLYSECMKEHLLPVPYMDNVSSDIYGDFDFKTKEFILTFKCSAAIANISTGSTGGFIRASCINAGRCFSCNGICSSSRHHVSWDGQRMFCSKRCARESGYVYAYTSEGVEQLRLLDTCYPDYFKRDRIYTNKNSCKRDGGLVVIHNYTTKSGKISSIKTKPKEFSSGGYHVVYQGTLHTMRKELYNELYSKRLACNSRLCSVESGDN